MLKKEQMYEKTINLSLSALYLPAVSILIAIGWQGLLLALHNWLRWGITKQEHIPWSGLGSTCSWAQAKEKGHPCTRIWAGSLSQMFPFQRSASELVVLIYGLKSLNAVRFFVSVNVKMHLGRSLQPGGIWEFRMRGAISWNDQMDLCF